MSPAEKGLLLNIREADRFIRENYPMDQPYIYTPRGHPIVFTKRMGFRDLERGKGKDVPWTRSSE